MRAFIAIELPDHIKEELNQTQNKLSAFCKKGRLTEKSNYHLTLRFIGEVNPQEYRSLIRAVDKAMTNHHPFIIQLGSLGSFKKRNRQIIWAGIKGEMEKVHSLYSTVEQALLEEGFVKEERPYTPHVTLARQVLLTESVDKLNKEINVKPLEFSVKNISVMESININGQLVYRPLYRGEAFK